MKTSEFEAGLKFCASESELRCHHAEHLFDALNLMADAAEGHAELIEAIRAARYYFRNTPRKFLAEREAEVHAHGTPSLQWLGR